jgi:hypothetical protein
MVGVNAMDDIDVMTCVTERVRQAINGYCIAAETVRRVVGR